MTGVLEKVVALLAAMGMLSVALPSPVAGPEAQLVPFPPSVPAASPGPTFKAHSTLLSATGGSHASEPPKIPNATVALPVTRLQTFTKVVASMSTPSASTDIEVGQPSASDNATRHDDASNSAEKDGEVDTTDDIGSAEALEQDGDDLTTPVNSIFPFIVMADTDPFDPTCDTSARRALWGWRNKCDRSMADHMDHHCWNKAPSTSRCCEDPNASVTGATPQELKDRGIMKKNAPKTCARYWPKNRAEEFMCCGVERKIEEPFTVDKWGWCNHKDGMGGKDEGRKCECVDGYCVPIILDNGWENSPYM